MKYTKSFVGQGRAPPRPTGWRSPEPLARFRGPICSRQERRWKGKVRGGSERKSKGSGGEGEERRKEGREGRGGREGREKKGKLLHYSPPHFPAVLMFSS